MKQIGIGVLVNPTTQMAIVTKEFMGILFGDANMGTFRGANIGRLLE